MAKLLRIIRQSNGKAPGMPSATGKRRVDREGPIHIEILHHLRRRFPAAQIHHSPNSIGLSGTQIMRQIAHNEAMGTVKGWPDLTCILPGPVIAMFEVKAPGNTPDPDQKALHQQLRALGCRVAVVRSVAEVDAALSDWSLIAASSAANGRNA
ncbi:VRR-NUC domain-containing protein [Paracoccus aestuariivivens]|uniref:VRR-NUC domain-containing protein n=1 Tax=Paracoccus aestuariivivens TaxID=1820333 RepID=A0A6L6JB97_9RHOB|nr:VRR-NUC domain-containing protein [Paracoccus aestuariivivens]MTH79402.1 VRR-NUC domain-containing protein [Paracoccus aestuariivivens]